MPTWKCTVMRSEDVNAMEDRQVNEIEKITAMDENQENAHNPKEPEIEESLSQRQKAPNPKKPDDDDTLSLIEGRIKKGNSHLCYLPSSIPCRKTKQKKFFVGLKNKTPDVCVIIWMAFLW